MSTGAVEARVRWLLAISIYEPRSWLQLASTLRARGRDGDATRVLVEMQNDRLRRGGLSRPAWLGHQILWVTIGHGYRSWLAGVWAMVVIALFALVVWRAPGNFDADPGVHGAPQPVAYAADTFLPIVDLGEASRWLATGWVDWVEWGVILSGGRSRRSSSPDSREWCAAGEGGLAASAQAGDHFDQLGGTRFRS